MRLLRLIPAMFILCVPGPACAQEWIEYYSRADSFLVNLPGQPKVQDITYLTEFGVTLPGHLHSYEDGRTRYSVTVIDYANVQKIHAARLNNCKAYPNLCNNPYVAELRGAMDFAAWSFLKRDAKVTYYAYANSDRIEGRRVQLMYPDRSQTFAAITCMKNRLYILEGTVPAGSPPPALFQQSMDSSTRMGSGFATRRCTPTEAPPLPPRARRGSAARCE